MADSIVSPSTVAARIRALDLEDLGGARLDLYLIALRRLGRENRRTYGANPPADLRAHALRACRDAWDLLNISGVEINPARRVVVSAMVDMLTACEREEMDPDMVSGSSEWATSLDLIDVDADHDGEGYVDCSSLSECGREIAAECARRRSAENRTQQDLTT